MSKIFGSRSGSSRLPISHLVKAAGASASTFRRTDYRGGANGACVRLAPQKDWEVNNPAELASVLSELEKIQNEFNNAQKGDRRVSMADMIVLGGCAAIKEAVMVTGVEVKVLFVSGRADASDDRTDAEAFDVLEPTSDAFHNFHGKGITRSEEEMVIDRASLLGLTAPEMAVLVGGMRVLGTNSCNDASLGVLTKNLGTLTNDFFANLLDMNTTWRRRQAILYWYRSSDWKGNLEGQPRGSYLWAPFGAPHLCRILRLRGFQRNFCQRFCVGLYEGHECGPLRPSTQAHCLENELEQ
jgi:catalase-peroxidase